MEDSGLFVVGPVGLPFIAVLGRIVLVQDHRGRRQSWLRGRRRGRDARVDGRGSWRCCVGRGERRGGRGRRRRRAHRRRGLRRRLGRRYRRHRRRRYYSGVVAFEEQLALRLYLQTKARMPINSGPDLRMAILNATVKI